MEISNGKPRYPELTSVESVERTGTDGHWRGTEGRPSVQSRFCPQILIMSLEQVSLFCCVLASFFVQCNNNHQRDVVSVKLDNLWEKLSGRPDENNVLTKCHPSLFPFHLWPFFLDFPVLGYPRRRGCVKMPSVLHICGPKLWLGESWVSWV